WSTAGYKAVRISGSYGPASLNLPRNGAANGTVTLTGSFTAPSTTGTQRATYQMQGPGGKFGDTFWVEINVTASTTDNAAFVSEGPPTDGTAFAPGATFSKTWTLKDSGTSTWSTAGYKAVRISGSYGPASLN